MSLKESTATSPPSSADSSDAVFVAPASYAQERLWFLEQLDDGGSTAYNVGIGLHLAGPLDVAALERALAEVVRRHEVLRTTLAVREGELAQFIAPPRPVRLEAEDLSGAADPQAAVRERTARAQQEPFDLAAGPVFRSVLLRTGAAEHVLLLVFDHVVCDAWSLRVMHRDLVAAYRAEVLGTPHRPDPPIQYADYAQWQREWLESGELKRQLGYWREHLAEPPEKVRFTAKSAAGTAGTASAEEPLAAQLVAGLEQRGRREGASLFMMISAAYAALLAHHTGREDLIVGTLLANRDHAEVEDLAGFFTNTVALRLNLGGSPTVSELIARIRGCALGAYAHQDIPFHRVVEELRPERAPGELPYFDVMIQLADVEREPADVGRLRIEPVPLDSRPAPVGLVLTLLKQAGGYTAVWDYRDDWIDAPRVAALQDHFARLLEQFAAGADCAVAGLSAQVPALAAADGEAGPAATAAPPRTAAAAATAGPWHQLVAQTWAEVLGYQAGELGPDDDFFDLGGHSLAAGRVASRLSRHCDRPVPIRILFDHPVLADFAAALAERSGAADG